MTPRDKPNPLGRPPLPAGERRVDVHVRLPAWVVEWLDEMAEHNGESRTACIEAAVERAYEIHLAKMDH